MSERPAEPDPQDADAWMTAGLAASHAQQSERAIECFTRAGQAAPTAGLPHLMLGAEWAARGEMDRAEAAFATAVRLTPALTIARYQLGLVQFCAGRTAVALLSWQALLELPATDALPHLVRAFTALSVDELASAVEHLQLARQRASTSNPALAADAQRMIERLQSLRPAAADARSPQPAAAAPSSASEELARFLLSGYKPTGPLH